jgi:predicted MFS family arabinose efflux permease
VFIKGNNIGFILAVVFAAISPFALPLETIMLPIYALDLFGNKSYAKILGLFVSVNVSGYALGAPVMNLCYDVAGSYVPALIIVSGIMLAVFVLLQFVISAARKEQKRVMAETL